MNTNDISCFFVSDLHGDSKRYEKLFALILSEKPKAVFIGGDLHPYQLISCIKENAPNNFITDYLAKNLRELKSSLQSDYPEIFIIYGNHDHMITESEMFEGEKEQLWNYVHNKKYPLGDYTVYGYAFSPPSPFLLKDWEKYDVSRFVDPGCVSPEDGYRSVTFPENIIKYATIKKDLELLAGDDNLGKAVFLFHSPPYKCNLDRAALDDKYIDHVPLDVNVGSIAIRKFLEERSPLLSLHGHVHESYRLTGEWQDIIGKTTAFSAAHEGKDLVLVRFDLQELDNATREHL